MTLRLGRYQDVLSDVVCDAVITDPPYSDRNHKGYNRGVSGVLHSANDGGRHGKADGHDRTVRMGRAGARSHSRRRQWRLTQLGADTRRDIEATTASTTEE